MTVLIIHACFVIVFNNNLLCIYFIVISKEFSLTD